MHAETDLQLLVPTLAKLKTTWVCLHSLHSLCSAETEFYREQADLTSPLTPLL